ncbi:hypothetical protein CJO79_23885 (plasmid) [Ralstonia solanacearum]|nr:hypothetical protein CJO79_23885 [Ralstonia solanacearum]AXW78822.1 hypothetical protein CJO97_23890 [Ralstonia solanacearum]
MAHGIRSVSIDVENQPRGKSMQIQTLQINASCNRAVLSVTAPKPLQGSRLQTDSAANTVP